jgi:hypothetical protein
MSVRNYLPKRVARVAAMSSKEIRVRAAQEFFKRWDFARSKIAIQTRGRAGSAPFANRGRFFFQRDDVPGILQQLRASVPEAPARIIADADRILDHKFDLLGYSELDYGKEIDWHRDAVHGKSSPRVAWFRVPYLDFERVGDHKVIWELSRHQHLVTLAKACRLTGNGCYAGELFAQWYHWRKQNPFPIGINWASSLEVAFRTLSWLWVWHLVEGTDGVPPRFASDLHRALMQSGRYIERYLSTYFAPNTHLLGEAVALFFVGTLAPASSSVLRWQQLGWKIILEQAERQVLADGMHFEQSTYYHVYALDFFLHARILADMNGIAVPPALDDKIEKMLDALCTLSGAGPLPQFGDDDGGRVFDSRRNQRSHMLDPLAIGAVLFRRSDFKRAARRASEEMVWLLGTNAAKTFASLREVQPDAKSSALKASGIYVMCSGSPSPQQLVIDAGPQGFGWAGHGHADALSLQLSADGKPILIDPGTATYVDVSGERSRFRETGCHNTVQIDGVSQAVPAAPFKWTYLAHANVDRWLTGETCDLFAGSHLGYSRLPTPVVHRRFVFHFKEHFWLVRDVLQGTGTHQADICWSFAPGRLCTIRDGVRFAGDDGARLTAVFAASAELGRDISQGWYSPRYGSKEPVPVFRVGAKSPLPLECATVLIPGFHGEAFLNAIQPEAGAGKGERSPVSITAYKLSVDDTTHEFFFSDCPGEWSIAGYTSDARFVHSFSNSADDCVQYVLCDGSYLAAGKRRLFASESQVAMHEWSRPSMLPVLGDSSVEEVVWTD